jgi:site-specific DNA recombinase
MVEMNTKAVGYVRGSTNEQRITLEAQEAKIRAMVTVKDAEIVEIISDGGESAASLDRPGMQRLLQMVDEGLVRYVIIAKLDRMTRSVRDLGDLLETFGEREVSLISVEESLDTGSAAGRLVMNVMVSVSQWEREIIGERTAAALQFLKMNNYPSSHPPYGYAAAPRTPEEKRARVRKRMILNPYEQKVLGMVRIMTEEAETLQAITDALNEAGYTTRSGGKFHITAVWRIQNSLLQNQNLEGAA